MFLLTSTDCLFWINYCLAGWEGGREGGKGEGGEREGRGREGRKEREKGEGGREGGREKEGGRTRKEKSKETLNKENTHTHTHLKSSLFLSSLSSAQSSAVSD